MAPRSAHPSDPLVTWDDLAIEDVVGIINHTSYQRGEEQALRYRELLIETARQAGRFPLSSNPIEYMPGLRLVLVKWRGAHKGHYLVFRPTNYGIHILRVLHSSMNLPDHLGEEDA